MLPTLFASSSIHRSTKSPDLPDVELSQTPVVAVPGRCFGSSNPVPTDKTHPSGSAAGRSPSPRAPLHQPGLPDENRPSSESNGSPLPACDNVSAEPEDVRPKKRRAVAGPRGVATLTPEQLAKKRANDREAQRAIRERTKNQIENLERQIQKLTSQQPYQDLQAVIRQKEAVEAENAEIRGRLASVIALIQPILTSQQAQGVYASPTATYAPVQQASHPLPPSYIVHNASSPTRTPSPGSTIDRIWHGEGQTQLSLSSYQVNLLNQQRHDSLHNLELGSGEHLKLNFLLDPSQRIERMQTGVNGAQDSPTYRHLRMKHDWNGVPIPVPPQGPTSVVSSRSHHHQRIDDVPEHPPQNSASTWVSSSLPVKNTEPTCPLDSLMLDFLNERRQRAMEGESAQDVVGPKYPSVSSLLNRAASVHSHPLSKVFTDILARFPGVCTLPEKVAILYVMFLLMRWEIHPSQENFNLLPTWQKPIPSQMNTPHPAWIDYLPFPQMRDKLAREYNPTDYHFDNFFIPYTNTVSLNWPYEETDALLQMPDGNEPIINPVFERHLRRLENWTLGDAFDRALPTLRGTYNLKSDGGTRTKEASCDR